MRKVLYDELLQYCEPNTTRCPCCDRILTNGKMNAGHIISHKDGGSTDRTNLLAICKSCNSNDTRHMYAMVKAEWGKEHIRAVNFENICIALGKIYRE